MSVIIPTYNERRNIAVLMDRLRSVLADFDYEILVVDDDSPDETWRVVEALATGDRRVRLLRRIGRRGLSSAVIDGMASANGRVFAVMDADLQHDESVLPDLISAVLDDDVDICLGSREAPGGGYGPFGRFRRLVSWLGAQLARRLLGITVGDPMSGYFAVSSERFDAVRAGVNPRGFKVLLELVARGPRPRIAEVGYHFRNRAEGDTKLNSRIALSYVLALMELTIARSSSFRFATYAVVATTALSLRLSLETMFQFATGSSLGPLAAAEVAILFEFGAHSRYTFALRRHGSGGTLSRLARFHAVSVNALLALVGIASLLEDRLIGSNSTTQLSLALAGSAMAVLLTIAFGYILNTALTWTDADQAVLGRT